MRKGFHTPFPLNPTANNSVASHRQFAHQVDFDFSDCAFKAGKDKPVPNWAPFLPDIHSLPSPQSRKGLQTNSKGYILGIAEREIQQDFERFRGQLPENSFAVGEAFGLKRRRLYVPNAAPPVAHDGLDDQIGFAEKDVSAEFPAQLSKEHSYSVYALLNALFSPVDAVLKCSLRIVAEKAFQRFPADFENMVDAELFIFVQRRLKNSTSDSLSSA